MPWWWEFGRNWGGGDGVGPTVVVMLNVVVAVINGGGNLHDYLGKVGA